ncbi:MAG: FAD-dependent oxidoreductase [Alphaproteobacteria bacterium]
MTAAMRTEGEVVDADVVVVGSGAAALTAALTAAVDGCRVVILEKSDKLGGTSAMSGAMTWVPANHHARAMGIEDSPEEALTYMRAVAPAGWRETEDELWRAQAENGPRMLEFVERHSPLRFTVTKVPDPMSDLPGARPMGRLLSPEVLRRGLIGRYGRMLRRSTMPQTLTYDEMVAVDFYRHPIRGTLRHAFTYVHRWLTGTASKGNALIVGLLKGCLDRGCRIETRTRATALVTDGEGGPVAGVVAETAGKRRTFRAARGVVLATGGFEWDAELLKKHFPGGIDYLSSPSTNTGDGLRMATAIGAATAHMDQANILPQPPIPYEGRINGLPIRFHAEPDALIVDMTGRRFVSEYAFHIGEAIDRRDPATGQPLHQPAWLVSHWPMVKRTPIVRWYKRYDGNWLVKARTVEELATKIGVPAAALADTVRRFNGFAATGRDTDHHRGEPPYEKRLADAVGLMAPIDRPPYVAIRCNRSLLGTKGGLRTNERGEVLRGDGSVIAGLYCAGNVMANPVGTRSPSAVGTTIGPYMTWGHICGLSIARSNRG